MVQMPNTFPVTAHTDFVGPDCTFVAIRGFSHDGAQHIPLALKKGARIIIAQHDHELSSEIEAEISAHNAQVIRVENARRELAIRSAQAAGNPADSLTIIGVTGTKGKTTTVFLLAHMLRAAGHRVALISSAQNMIEDTIFTPSLTTPQPDYMHQFLALCIKQGVTHVVMEVAAHALTLDRVYGIAFAGALFTNFSREHLEFYASMDDYFAAKCALFDYCMPGAPRFACADDAWCMQLRDKKEIRFFGCADAADMRACMVTQDDGSIVVQLTNALFHCPSLIGIFNGYNMLAALLMARAFGVSDAHITAACKTFSGVPGRMERYPLPNGATAIIDYAHNPVSYEALLSTLRALTDQLIVVFGMAGERDAGRRPIMGKIVAQYADYVLLTTDNPRSEDPKTIVHDVLAGVAPADQAKFINEPDRARAIERAYAQSQSGALIVLLGKGPDEYQIIGTIKTPFSERALLVQLQRHF